MTHLFEIAKTDYPALFKLLNASGIKALSPDNWSHLQSACQLIQNPSFSTLNVHKKIAGLKQKIAQSRSPFFLKGLHQEILHWGRLTNAAYQKWQQQQIDCLNDPLWWSHGFSKIKSFPLEKQAKAESRLKKLQQTWFLQGHYAHYSTLDLVHVYQSVMPLFAEWLYYAKSEFEKQRPYLAPHLSHAYQRYLDWFDEALQTEKQRLRTCLQGRLVIGLNAGNGHWDNLLGAIHAELQAIEVLPQQPKLTQALAHGHLTPEAFVSIRKIIETDGNDAEKTAFYALAYHRDFESTKPDVWPPYRFDAKGNSYFIPPELNTAIPLKPRFYHWLLNFLPSFFCDEQVYTTFFQHPVCQFLLAQEIAFLPQPVELSAVTLNNFLQHPAWQENALCLKYCMEEHLRTEQWLCVSPFIRFLFPDAIRLLQRYQSSLAQRAEKWFMKQCRLLKQVIAAQENLCMEPQVQTLLNKTLDDLEILQKAWDLKGDSVHILQQIRQDYLQPITHDHVNQSLNTQKPTVRHQFRQSIQQAIAMVETTPSTKLAALKTQLNLSSTLYDSVALRFAVVDVINTGTLPNELSSHLQRILDQPAFSEVLLNQAENRALGELKKRLPERLPRLIKNPLAVLDENPLDYDLPALTQHCAVFKESLVPLTDPNVLSWQAKFNQYSLRFFKAIQNLSWEDFVVYRIPIQQVLDLLIEISTTHFIALHHSLMALSMREKNISEGEWALFKEIYLETPIQSLTTCLQNENMPVKRMNCDGASYQSQTELVFLPSKLAQKSRVLENDPPKILTTNTL